MRLSGILNDPFYYTALLVIELSLCSECGIDDCGEDCQCFWMARKSPKCLFPLGFRHPAGGGPSHGHRQHVQKNW